MTQIVSDKSGKGGQATVAWIIAVLTLGYMLPWAIAASRGKSNSGSVGLINLLLGWTLIGWVIALVMACTSHQAVAVAAPAYVAPAPAAVAPTAAGLAALVAQPVGTQAGWLEDGAGQLRWWDGAAWTEHVHVPEAPTV